MRMYAEIDCCEQLREDEKFPIMNRAEVKGDDLYLDGTLIRNAHYFTLVNVN